MNHKLRVGVVGAGAIGQTYLEILKGIEEVHLAAVAECDSLKMAAVAQAYGVNGYRNTDEMLKKEEIDAVVISTTPVTHAEIALQCMGKNVNVLCEKPFALSLQEAEEMIKIAKKRNLTLTMASKFRYVTDLMKAKELIAKGTLGDIISCENIFCSYVDMKGRWNSIPRISGGGVIIDNGTHSVDIIRYLFGPITRILAVKGRPVQGIGVEENACIFVKTMHEALGIIHLSWNYSRHFDSFINIFGTLGMARIGWKEACYKRVDMPDWIKIGEGYNKTDAIRAQVLNFIHSIRGSERLLITSEDAIASVRVIQAAYKSMDSNQWEEVY